ncbi:Hpt domain-containing protein [Hyphococcus sp.]|uniref:Hpt domain-containing protein n=1 Tax=Hyphococcus sp. TaxID=2038636 RepID=UPI003CCC0803
MSVSSAIDFKHLDKYVMGDDDLRDEVLEIFIDQLHLQLRNLDPSKDDISWKHTAHTLKGAARGVGAWDVGDLCQEAELLVGDINNKQKAREALLAALRDKAESAEHAARNITGVSA